jgi:phosphate-selective porin OprO/OprP
MERALSDAFAPGRNLGVAANTWGKWWQAAGGVFGQEIGEEVAGQDQGWGVTGRVSVAPFRQPRRVLHLGFASSYRTPDADATRPNRVRFRSKPEADLDDTYFLNTGQMRDIDHTELYGAELAGVWGPFSVQGESVRAKARGIGSRSDVDMSGGYVFASWFLTGESRVYLGAEGEFGRIHPRSKRGAVELAVRTSTLDLDDDAAGVLGGKGENVTIAVNWYVNPNVRLASNYVIVNNNAHATDNGAVKGDDDFSIAQFRLQITF